MVTFANKVRWDITKKLRAALTAVDLVTCLCVLGAWNGPSWRTALSHALCQAVDRVGGADDAAAPRAVAQVVNIFEAIYGAEDVAAAMPAGGDDLGAVYATAKGDVARGCAGASSLSSASSHGSSMRTTERTTRSA